ncbi:unnamed protein product [Didymodactylos carnosus]|uniref:Uncharacterized protein n=1 Tax=Didymodactylos carnosus TaxID=1234261 RepID=A0A8S2JW78_9BILA|nr:unnamed protein product [Didymodactylos carnosus]CAF3826314.1 unnamed protein product [Didymodactylos carnosus]
MMLSTSNVVDISEERNEQNICETMVHEYLEELNNIIEQYQNEFDRKKNYLIDYTDDMEKASHNDTSIIDPMVNEKVRQQQ